MASSHSPVNIGTALLTLERWAEELAVMNNRKSATDENAVRRLREEFRNSVYPVSNGTLSFRERSAKILFDTFAAGFGDTQPAGGETGPLAAWKKNVARSVFRDTYQQIEQIIVDSVAQNGANATLDKFPSFGNAADVAATLDYLNLDAKNLPSGAVAAMLRGIDQTHAPAPARAAATP